MSFDSLTPASHRPSRTSKPQYQIFLVQKWISSLFYHGLKIDGNETDTYYCRNRFRWPGDVFIFLSQSKIRMPAILDLSNTYGAFLIGVVVSAA